MQNCSFFFGFCRLDEEVYVMAFWRTWTVELLRGQFGCIWSGRNRFLSFFFSRDCNFTALSLSSSLTSLRPFTYLVTAHCILSRWCMFFLRWGQFAWMAFKPVQEIKKTNTSNRLVNFTSLAASENALHRSNNIDLEYNDYSYVFAYDSNSTWITSPGKRFSNAIFPKVHSSLTKCIFCDL